MLVARGLNEMFSPGAAEWTTDERDGSTDNPKYEGLDVLGSRDVWPPRGVCGIGERIEGMFGNVLVIWGRRAEVRRRVAVDSSYVLSMSLIRVAT